MKKKTTENNPYSDSFHTVHSFLNHYIDLTETEVSSSDYKQYYGNLTLDLSMPTIASINIKSRTSNVKYASIKFR